MGGGFQGGDEFQGEWLGEPTTVERSMRKQG
jgi:hypothetical protein